MHHKLILIMPFLLGVLASQAINPKNGGDVFESLLKKAEEKYQTSTDAKTDRSEGREAGSSSLPSHEERQIAPSNYVVPPSRILSSHHQYSLDWWKTLFKNCQPCDKFTTNIDCRALLQKNPQWQELQEKDDTVKRKVIETALDFFVTRNGDAQSSCVLASALCAGSDPDARMNTSHGISQQPHTALHVLSLAQCGTLWNIHSDQATVHHEGPGCPCTDEERRCKGTREDLRGMLRLMFEKGVSPSTKCVEALPSTFMPQEWLQEFAEYRTRRGK